MVSLCIFCGVFLTSMFLLAGALTLAARAVGSPRGRFRVGLVAVLLIFCINIAFTVVAVEIRVRTGIPPLVRYVILLLGELCVIFVVLSSVFRLSFGRTFAPFVGYGAITLAILGFALTIMKPYLLEAYVFPDVHSMMPAINPGDRFVVSKIIQPRRWDLVAHWSNEEVREVFCQRLIGLPGERLRFDQGGIFINDQPVTAPSVLAGHCHASLSFEQNPRYHDGQTIVLGNDEYFFIGDNIDISGDSRHYGPTRRSSLIGVVDLMYWPLSRFRIVR